MTNLSVTLLYICSFKTCSLAQPHYAVSTSVVSEYTGSLLASMKALYGLGDILTEHIFLPQI